ncbi:cell envelope biogenesis protein TolA [Rhodobacter maris]|uniref:Cell division and transport-associated protein TolA n=1 Tax=Rhodobacter maris TaxID=446682 RepID=A0A285RLE3_9RHOB|nr:cell envelope biogenesis protein TolA [Rhodobacter maris]SOB94548.1 cell division and transport-associated protein TolA [Rhodobacter maris]
MRMDRAEKIGTGVSAALHAAVILWALIGTWLFPPTPTEPVEVKPAGMISEAEFAALQAAAPKAGEAPPEQPEVPAEEAPAPEEPTPEAVPETPVPPEKPATPPEAEAVPDMSDLTEPTPPAEVTEVPPSMMPPVEEPQDTDAPEFSPRPRPKPAMRVAPTPSEAPAPDAKVSDTAVAETKPEETAEPEKPVEEPKEEAAPPEATTEIVTEATEAEEKPTTSAPKSSPRPRTKPTPPKPDAPKPATPSETATAAATPAKPAKPAKPAASKPTSSDAVADALAEAMAEDSGTGTGGLGIAKNGPPVTAGEKEALIVDVKACWNVGALSSEAMRTSVTVRVDMQENGHPVSASIKMAGYTGGSEAAAKQAFEAARRAIIRCGSDGFPLPAEKYGWWQQIEIVFDPSKMRMK